MDEGTIWFISIAVLILVNFNIDKYPKIFLELAPITLATLILTVVNGIPISNALAVTAIFYTLILFSIMMLSEKRRYHVNRQIQEYLW